MTCGVRCKYSAGDLRRQVTIQTRQKSQGDGGVSNETVVDVATVWAQIKPITGSERLKYAQLEDTITHKVVMRYRSPKPIAAQQLKYTDEDGERYFNIRYVFDLEEAHVWLELLCTEGDAL